jgi:hypothetical protein
MPGFLSSPRRRRRLGWTLAVVVPLVAIVVVSVLYRKSGSEDTPVAADTTGAAPVVATIRVTPAVRRQVDETVQTFVHTAVIRRNLAAAWPLASPAMRQSVTRSEWLRGDLPVQPYPAAALRAADWSLRYRNERTLGIDVMVQPKQGSGAPVAVYSAELSAPGSGAPRRFVVDSWFTQTTLGAAAGPSEPGGSKTETTAADDPELAYDSGKLGTEWFLVPAAILLLALATLGGFGVRSIVRARRAERRYREEFRRPLER